MLAQHPPIIFQKNMKKATAYISGSLSSLPAQEAAAFKVFYEQLASVLASHGISTYVPHVHSDPEKHADMSPQSVYEIDVAEVKKADLLVCEMSNPSHGVGGEIEVAAYAGRDILLISKEGKWVSRFSRGNPAIVDHITYSSFEDGAEKVNTWIVQWLKRQV